MSTPERIAERKALLVSRSELERMQIALDVHELRERIALPAAEAGGASGPARAIAAAVVGVGLPLLGRNRLSRMLRAGSLALTAWRIARNWRSTGR
jgi:hypothetical protein